MESGGDGARSAFELQRGRGTESMEKEESHNAIWKGGFGRGGKSLTRFAGAAQNDEDENRAGILANVR